MNCIINIVNYKLTWGGGKLTKPYNINDCECLTINKYLEIDNFFYSFFVV